MTKRKWISATLLASSLAMSLPMQAQTGVATQTVVTVMPKKAGQTVPVTAQDLKVTVDNKAAQISGWVPLRGERGGLQMMFLIDSSARSSLSLQYADIKKFLQRLPDGAQVGVAYMRNGQAVIQQNITPDRALAGEALRLLAGSPGDNGSPYFCLSNLVRNWPSNDPTYRREIVMITDGVDLYYGRSFNPDDPYVQTAISDAQKTGVLVHTIFYKDTGRFSNNQWTQAGAQSYLQQVADGTGGTAYGMGFSNPVSFVPFLDDLDTRLMNQYELGILAQPRSKTQLQQLKIKTSVKGVNIDAPQMVVVPGSESAR